MRLQRPLIALTPGPMNSASHPVVRAVVETLLARGDAGARVSVDEIADCLGAAAVTQLEIEAIFEKADAELLKNRKPRPERPFPDDDEEEEDEGRGGGREDDEDDDF